ncbi:MAG: DsbA family protein [Rhodobacteraceae bacterium]|nr:DsbA family protein [Paracoccaceae bacterium]
MIRALLAIVLATVIALPAAATDIDNMTDAERETFRAEVRAYLLDNPEVLAEAIAVLRQREAEAETVQDQRMVAANADAIFNDGFSWVGGNPDGDITIVEFLDYRCTYCKKAFPEVAELLSSDGNIRFIVKEFPILGEASVLASRFAIAVKNVEGDEAYGEVHDRLMTLRAEISESSLKRLAEDMELDFEAIFAEMNSDEITAIIRANHELADKLNISGTPAFVMEDQMLRGYVPLADMRRIVAALRAQ